MSDPKKPIRVREAIDFVDDKLVFSEWKTIDEFGVFEEDGVYQLDTCVGRSPLITVEHLREALAEVIKVRPELEEMLRASVH
jgi:hypothetical protein